MLKPILIPGLGLLLGASLLLADDKENQLAVIVGKSNPQEALSSVELLKVFRSEKIKGADGNRIVVIMHAPGQAERDAALKGIYKMSEGEYNKYFLQATFTGAVQGAPKAFPNAAAVKQAVASMPGAISYVRASDLDESVKPLKIDGKAPGEADYPLKLK